MKNKNRPIKIDIIVNQMKGRKRFGNYYKNYFDRFIFWHIWHYIRRNNRNKTKKNI